MEKSSNVRVAGKRDDAERVQVVLDLVVRSEDPAIALALLAGRTDLSKQKLKEAMNKGAVWLTQPGRKPKRLRRATAAIRAGDRLQLYYDSRVLACEPPVPVLIEDYQRYSAWFKPAGLLIEGSRYGDHCSLERLVEKHFHNRAVFLVHRLDREAAGVVIVAHSSQAAAKLGELFRERRIEKEYDVEVKGILGEVGSSGTIDVDLDGKPSRTDYRVTAIDTQTGVTQIRVGMLSGRYHQIRRHFASIDHPVMGDPKYGVGNTDLRGMRLVASCLAFECPWTHEQIRIRSIDANGC